MPTAPSDFPVEGDTIRVALCGADYPGLRIRDACAVGDKVRTGQIVFRDATRPAIGFASPLDGTVAAIELGARRRLAHYVIEGRPGDGAQLPPGGGDTRTRLVSGGLWPAFVRRPFGGPPDPEASPDAIVVTALPLSATAPDPSGVLADRTEAFDIGLHALTDLTEGPVFLCATSTIARRVTAHLRIRHIRPPLGRRWLGRGTQIARAIGRAEVAELWSVGFQDVAAIGAFLRTARYDPIRTVSVSHGPETQLLRVPLGCALHAVLPEDGGVPLSGSWHNGRRARFLGRQADEISSGPEMRHVPAGRPKPIIPFSALTGVLPFGVPTIPLMRALATGDETACAHLGGLLLLEEDVAHLSRVCASGTDYAARLRAVLEQRRRAAA